MLCPFCQQSVVQFENPVEDGQGLRCPICGEDGIPLLYPNNYAAHPAVPVCIFGPTAHGKSVYIDALLTHLETRINWPRFSCQWMDQAGMEASRERLRQIREFGTLPDATNAVFPRPQVIRLRNVPRVMGCQLLFYDTGGEAFQDVERFMDAGRYLRHARAVVWLVSLTQIEYRGQLSDMLTIYAEAMHRLGGDPKQQTLVMALTKGDLLLGLEGLPDVAKKFLENDTLDPEGDSWNRLAEVSDALEAWLRIGEHANVANLLPELFGAVRYCIVSAQGSAADEENRLALEIMPRGVLAPLFWLWRETLPTVTVVAGPQKRTFFSLKEAIEAAPSGATIQLGPHQYLLPSRLEITRPIEIVGKGPDQTIIVGMDERFVIGVAPSSGTVVISSVTVAHKGTQPADVVRVVRGAFEMKKCSITGGVAGEATVPGDGVLVLKAATATLQDCSAHTNQGNGIAVREEGKIVVRRCSSMKNSRSGLYARASSAEVHYCNFNSNSAHGIDTGLKTRSELTNNRCEGNGEHGIALYEESIASLRSNRCDGNGRNGIAVRGRVVISAVDNGCSQNRSSGASAEDQVTGTFHKTTFRGNGANGFVLNGNARLVLTENECRGNRKSGIAYGAASGGECKDNICQDNNADGIEVGDSSGPSLLGNHANNNAGFGFNVSSSAAPVLGPGNEARGNQQGETRPQNLLRRRWFG